jgi:hypothetical protein
MSARFAQHRGILYPITGTDPIHMGHLERKCVGVEYTGFQGLHVLGSLLEHLVSSRQIGFLIDVVWDIDSNRA